MYGRKIVARIVGKTDGQIGKPIVVKIGERIAVRIPVVNSAGWIEPIKWRVNMASKGETMPVPPRWNGPIVPSASNVHSGLSDPNGRRDRNDRRSRSGVAGTSSGLIDDHGIHNGVRGFPWRRYVSFSVVSGGLRFARRLDRLEHNYEPHTYRRRDVRKR